MQSVLIANRGEIAVRIIRACRELGLRSIAVCSEADRTALHARLADTFAVIGPAAASESYLNAAALLEAASRCGADSVHPGYGFLSERADFAQACADAGLTFIGPAPSAIRLLGDKIEARALMESSGVPVTPGYNGANQTEAGLEAAARQIGFPILIKAAAGGGGRGMRAVHELGRFKELLGEARKEAMAAFGDDRMLLERYIPNSRHVEFQIFGDVHGEVISLFERDCSIQRRHQKIVEESPCPVLDPHLRNRMAEAAVRVGRAVGYTNAGTVEFLLEIDPEGNHQFYFMEVNTRIQVEHPVTEMVTGIDLVRLQLRCAAGAPLAGTGESASSRGHAIEVRIYAEDPARGFLPSTGKIERWIMPGGPGVRVDAGVAEGDTITPFYDPMLAKLIVFAETRPDAIARLKCALDDFVVLGVDTNIPYLQAIIGHPEFLDGRAGTRFISENFSSWAPQAKLPDEVLLALAARHLSSGRSSASHSKLQRGRQSLWQSAGRWRNN